MGDDNVVEGDDCVWGREDVAARNSATRTLPRTKLMMPGEAWWRSPQWSWTFLMVGQLSAGTNKNFTRTKLLMPGEVWWHSPQWSLTFLMVGQLSAGTNWSDTTTSSHHAAHARHTIKESISAWTSSCLYITWAGKCLLPLHATIQRERDHTMLEEEPPSTQHPHTPPVSRICSSVHTQLRRAVFSSIPGRISSQISFQHLKSRDLAKLLREGFGGAWANHEICSTDKL